LLAGDRAPRAASSNDHTSRRPSAEMARGPRTQLSTFRRPVMRLRALLTVLVLLLVVPVTADAAVGAAPASGPLAVLSILLISFAVLTGTRIVPTGAVGTELTAVTRRAFVPRVPVQIYKATAILSAAL